MNFGNITGQTLDGKYKIEKQLGKGGMGTVYLATHIGTERPVAVKVIASEFMQRAEFVERFRREARAAGRLRHPNVVDVTDFGFSDTRDGEVAYLVMEYLDGCTLGEILEEEKNLPLDWAVDILEQVCSAVHEAHEQGIIHRDLKPDNIWLEPNQRGGYTVKVLDFGIAKLEEAQITVVSDFESRPDRTGRETQFIGDKGTLADRDVAGTLVENKKSTVVSEGRTILQGAAEGAAISDNETIISEAGTIIQEDGDGAAGVSVSGKKIIGPDVDAATKLISDQIDTNKSGAETTGKSLLNVPATAELTRVGSVLGTPLYMSPEQCRGEKLTAHSDVYSLAVIAYQMLGGKTPFEGIYSEVMEAHKEIEPPPLEAKKIPKKVKRVIIQSLAKKPEDRPQTAEGFASELRSSSEGIGILLQRALVIYSQRLPKFLQIAFFLAIPPIILTYSGVLLRFLVIADIVSDSLLTNILGGLLGFITFFVQIFYSAMLVGITTWIVAQILAAPLRPISVRTSFRQVGKRWKPLAGTVTASTLLSFLSWILGGAVGAIISLVISIPIYFLTGSSGPMIGLGIGFAVLGAVVLGVLTSAAFMLIAPSIMMEGVNGRSAFRRSIELVRRSFRTVLATAILVYVVPVVLAIGITVAVGGIINAVSPMEKTPTAGSEQVNQNEAAEEAKKAEEESGGINFSLGKKAVVLTDGKKEEEKTMADKVRGTLQQGIFELLWSPLIILLSSFTAVLTALLYFKTRQAGGESMQGLLQQFEEAECSTSKWQTRVRHRLLQSGRTTGGKKFTAG